jgi:DNA-binding GntR family transcriptional regulator
MAVPDLTDRRHPYLQIADDLQGKIAAGQYQPGDKLPSNTQMQQEYGSSKQTITNAVRELQDRGLVATHSTRGAFVLESSGEPEPAPELARLEARLTRHIDDEIAKLRDELEYVQAQVMALDAREGGAADRSEGVG